MNDAELAAWLVARLTSNEGRQDWRELIEAGMEAVLDRPVAEVVSPSAVDGALDALLREAASGAVARGGVSLVVAAVVEEARTDHAPVGRFLDDAARARLETLVAREGLVDEEWVDVIFSQGATEELFADTLFRALEDFSSTIPQVLQSVTPSAFGKIASRLGGATEGVRGKVFEEMNRRLEPEIRKFVQRATRRLLDGTATFVKSGLDREGAREARKNLLRHGLSRSPASYVRHFDDDTLADLEQIWISLAGSKDAQAELRARIKRLHDRFLERFGERSLRATLAAHDVSVELDYDVWASATWPSVRVLLESPGARRVLERLSGEILIQIRGD